MFHTKDREFKAWMSACKVMITILIVGLVIRFVLAPITAPNYDVSFWIGTINGAYGGDTIYESGYIFYPPVWGYILSVMSVVMDVIGFGSMGDVFTTVYHGQRLYLGRGIIPSLEFNLLIKTPAIIFDVLTGIVAYTLVKRITGSQKKAVVGFAMWFMCPLVIMSSSVLSMFESIMIFLMMLSILTFMDKRYFMTGVILSIAVLTKVFAVLIIPVMIAYIISERDLIITNRLKNILCAAGGFILMTILIYLPILMAGEMGTSILFFTSRENVYSEVGGFEQKSSFLNLFAYVPLLIVIYLAIFIYMMYRKDDRENVFLQMTILSIIPIFSLPYLSYSPQYGMVLMPAILILYSLKGRIAFIPLTLLIVYAISGIFVYWHTILLPLAAYTDMMDINSAMIAMPYSSINRKVIDNMFWPGLSVFIIMICYLLISRLKEWRVARG